jgi:hypothetical protein
MHILPEHVFKFILSVRSGSVCSLETTPLSKSAFREISHSVNNGWANLVDIASTRGLNLLTVQLGSMEAGLLCTPSKAFIVYKTLRLIHATNISGFCL